MLFILYSSYKVPAMDIIVRIPNSHNEWSSSVLYVSPSIRSAFVEYKERDIYQEATYITSEYIVYRPANDRYLPTYIARVEDIPAMNDGTGIADGVGLGLQNNLANNIIITQEIHDIMENQGKSMPIMDMNDVSVFVVDNPSMSRANWSPARQYQVWAYRDFMYDRHRTIKKSYMSRGTMPYAYQDNDRILQNQIVTINIPNIQPNIIFNMSRNENNSVYYERNDEFYTRVRICDNESARSGYLGFYTRLTMDPGIIVTPPPHVLQASLFAGAGESSAILSTSHLKEPEETDIEEHQCILCFMYRVNTRFSPCEHHVCCTACYSKMSKNECPVCRAKITQIMNV